jgi:DNA primase
LRIPDDKIEEVRSVIDIVDVVSDYVTLKKKGTNFFGLCPFHEEKTPSFSVNPERGIYKCFGCGKGGNVFSFLMDVEKLGFIEALRLLADRAGVPLPEPTEAASAVSSELEPIYHALRLAARYFHTYLEESEDAQPAREYLEGRGFSHDSIKKFGLGFAPDQWDGLLRHAESQSTSTDYLESAGLVIKRDKGDGFYDRFRGRIIFPLFSQVGQVVGFTGRLLEADAKQAKYVNTPETRVYYKGKILYGLNFSKNEIRRAEEAYLVEGNTDVVSLFQAGVTNVVATSGTALTHAQVSLLGRYTQRVIILFDADDAGVKATLRSIDLMLQAGMRTYVLSLPDGSDPDGFVGEKGRDGFLSYADKHRTDFVSFMLSASGYRRDSGDPEADWESIRSVLASIALIPNSVRREGYLRLASEQTGMPDGTLRGELKSLAKQSARQSTRRSNFEAVQATPVRAGDGSKFKPVDTASEPARILSGERDLVRLMLEKGDRMIGYVLANMGLDEFSAGPPRKTVEALLGMYQKGEVDTGKLLAGDGIDEVREFAAGLMIHRDQPSLNWRSIHAIEVPPMDANAKRSASDAMRSLKLQRVEFAIEEQNRRIFETEKANGDVTEPIRELQALQKLRKHVADLEFVEWSG